jgi:serine/threonine-protein kinase
MELLDGEPLSARVRRGPVGLADAVSVLLEILAALESLHSRGIVHRDMKPSNVFVTRQGVKLVDFGLARHATDVAETRPELTAAGVIVGTPRYMAPEQLLGQPADSRTDLFSVGCIFYELLTGRPTFDVDSLPAAMHRILNEDPPALVGSPGIAAADRIIQRALSRAPRARYASASTMADDVRSLLVYCHGETPASTPEARTAKSIAVLPFAGIGSGPETEEFADGMTEDVIARLSQIGSLKVIARTSVMRFRNQQSLKEIGARLGVRTLLTGSTRRAGTRVRIVTQLLDAATETQLWSATYDRELTDIFAIQAEVAEQIARALEAELTSAVKARLARKPTDDVAAYQLFLKGRHCLLKYTPDGVRQGIEFLTRAIGADPSFALAHTWMSLGHVISGMGYDGGLARPEVSYRLAKEAAEQAVALDADLGDAHGALAFVKLVMEFDWSGSERGFRRALELNPNSDLLWAEYGLLLSALARYDEAIAAYRRAKEIDPLAPLHSSTLASVLLRADRVDEALDEATRLLELQPEYALAHSNLGWALLARGAVEEGLAAIEKATTLSPLNTMLLGQLGHACAVSGRTSRARDILVRMNDLAATRYVSPYHLAYVHAGLGEHDTAIDCLERAFDEHAVGVYGMNGSFLFTGLRAHPRFRALLRKMNL